MHFNQIVNSSFLSRDCNKKSTCNNRTKVRKNYTCYADFSGNSRLINTNDSAEVLWFVSFYFDMEIVAHFCDLITWFVNILCQFASPPVIYVLNPNTLFPDYLDFSSYANVPLCVLSRRYVTNLKKSTTLLSLTNMF